MRVSWLLLGIIGAGFALGAASRQAAPGPARVAVVDLMRVLNEARPFKDEERQIREWILAEKDKLKALSSDVERGQQELEKLLPGSSEYVTKARELDELKLRFRHLVEDRERERNDRIVAGQKRWFERARQVISEVASGRGIDVVLQRRSEGLDGRRPEELSSEIFLTDVLYCNAALDITPDVLKILDR